MRSSGLSIVSLSHLAWERKLFQRPQQLMARFASQGHDVSYFALVGLRRYLEMALEERVVSSGSLTAMNLPFLPLAKRIGISRLMTMALLRSKAKAALKNARPGSRVLWLQNPAYVDQVDRLPHDLVVYDVMDPFSEFRTSDPRVAEREERTLQKADIVFTGGRSLHSVVINRHSDVHCFPSGIDFDHFARAARPGPIPSDIAKITKPILGYFGAVDERIDWDLIQSVCRARAHWSVVFLGPLVLIPEIPIREPNFYWLGAKSYDALPDYLRAFDVCIIPWVVNDLTKFMSPTKTPEYLAAGKPVVSTPIPDVAADYAKEVLIAGTSEAFVECCTTALMRGPAEALRPPQSKTWDEIAAEMMMLIQDRLDKKNQSRMQSRRS